jgi:DNA-binding response OmpR family regulator
MKRILLIDHHDLRRDTRERLLQDAGYEVVTAENFDAVEGHIRETAFDLVIVAVTVNEAGRAAIAYSKRLRAASPKLPILALSDNGLFLPKESLIAVLQSGYAIELVAEVARMLLESTHVRNHKNNRKGRAASRGTSN